MSTLFAGINLALRAMLSHQQAVQVVEHNVANANTPGYRRQEAVLTASQPYPYPGLHGAIHAGQLGTGVTVDRIDRFNLEFFEHRLRRETAESKRWELQRDTLQQVEVTLAETSSSGIVPVMDDFWNAWQALSANPSDQAVRAELVDRAATLADAFNQRARSLNTLRVDQDQALIDRVEAVNTAAAQVARLNAQIANVKSTGDQPNDLLDQRDVLLDRLAEISGAVSNLQTNGEVVVSIGGHALVVGSSAFTLAATSDPANHNLAQITWDEDGRPLRLSSGELSGLLAARDQDIPSQLSGLNDLAYTLAEQVNALHRVGYGLNNSTGLDFFAPFTSTDYALEIRLGDDILSDAANVAAAAAPDSPGDGSLAIQIAELSRQPLMSAGSATMSQFYSGKIAELGLALSGASSRADERQSIADSLEALRESVSGVSLDEEAANLVKAQRAYQAAARLLTAVDEMIDRVINGMGVVGR